MLVNVEQLDEKVRVTDRRSRKYVHKSLLMVALPSTLLVMTILSVTVLPSLPGFSVLNSYAFVIGGLSFTLAFLIFLQRIGHWEESPELNHRLLQGFKDESVQVANIKHSENNRKVEVEFEERPGQVFTFVGHYDLRRAQSVRLRSIYRHTGEFRNYELVA